MSMSMIVLGRKLLRIQDHVLETMKGYQMLRGSILNASGGTTYCWHYDPLGGGHYVPHAMFDIGLL